MEKESPVKIWTTTLRLPMSLMKKAKIEAVNRKVSLCKLIKDALENMLEVKE